MDGPFLAIDIGGTKLAAAIVDDAGEFVVRDRVPTPPRDVWPALARLVRRVVAASGVVPAACGVGCGGPMDPAEGVVSPLHIPSWRGFRLRDHVEELTGLPAVVDNDAKALALGEAWVGAAAGVEDLIGVVVGTGVGGGIISRGRLVHGRLGNAGHIGHVVVEPDGRPCRCGGLGCLEAYCSGPSIEAETGRPPQRSPQAIMERTGTLVGRALASVGAMVDLRLAVVGGSVALGFGNVFFDAAQRELESRAKLSFTTGFRVVPAALGQFAPLVGAAALAKYSSMAVRPRTSSTPPATQRPSGAPRAVEGPTAGATRPLERKPAVVVEGAAPVSRVPGPTSALAGPAAGPATTDG